MSQPWLTLARLHPQPADTVDAQDAVPPGFLPDCRLDQDCSLSANGIAKLLPRIWTTPRTMIDQPAIVISSPRCP